MELEKEMTSDDLDIEPGAAIDLLADLVNAGSGARAHDALDRAIRATADNDEAEVGQSPPSIPT